MITPRYRRIASLTIARRVSAPTFSPASIAGLALWLRADRGAYSDAGKKIHCVAGDAVACWADQSGNGLDATQATISARPTYRAGAVDVRPALVFDGVDDLLLVLNAPDCPQPLTHFLVLNSNATASAYVFDGSPFDRSGLSLFAGSPSIIRLHAGAGGVTAAFLRDIPQLATCVANGTSSAIYCGGILGAAGDTGTNSLSPPWQIGGLSGYALNLAGEVTEILVYRAALPDTDRRQVESYLMKRHGITA